MLDFEAAPGTSNMGPFADYETKWYLKNPFDESSCTFMHVHTREEQLHVLVCMREVLAS